MATAQESGFVFDTNLLHAPDDRGTANVERAAAALQHALQCCRDTGHATDLAAGLITDLIETQYWLHA